MRRTRRNHAIEHATVHLLTARRPCNVAARADSGGFYLYGDVDTAELRAAVIEAIARLKTEPGLAVHPRCGTNLVVGGLLAGLASLAAVLSASAEEQRAGPWSLLPRLLLAGTAAAVVSQPAGPWVQRRLVTRPDVAGVRVAAVTVQERGRHRLHRVELTDGE